MRCFLIISFCLSLFFLAGAAKKSPLSKEPSGPLERQVALLGWSRDGSKLIFREETNRANDRMIRAVILNAETGKMINEHAIEEVGDGPDIVSVRENNLKVLMEHDGYQAAAPSQFFIGAGKRGFLSPNGQYLLFAKFQFNPTASKRSLLTLTIHFFLTDLKTAQEWEVAQMMLENLDGEHPFTTDSVSAVNLAEIQWGPRHNQLAVVLEEKRKDFLVKGVFVLSLKNLPDLDRPSLTQAETQEAKLPHAEPTPKKTPHTPAFSASARADLSLQDYYLPEGGSAQLLEWNQGASAAAPNPSLQALHNYYLACGNTPFSSQVTVYHSTTKKLAEIALGPAVSPKDLSLRWGKAGLQILFLGETLRTIAVDEKNLESMQKSPRAYAVQLGSYAKEDTAKKEVTRLCDLGLPAYYLTFADDKSGEPRYRLRLGRYREEAKAKQFAKERVKALFPKYLITRF